MSDYDAIKELEEQRDRWYGKAIARQIEINRLREALQTIADDEFGYDHVLIARKALSE